MRVDEPAARTTAVITRAVRRRAPPRPRGDDRGCGPPGPSGSRLRARRWLLELHEACRLREALGGEERRAIVHDLDTPSETGGEAHQRNRVVTGAAHQEPDRWDQRFDERLHSPAE